MRWEINSLFSSPTTAHTHSSVLISSKQYLQFLVHFQCNCYCWICCWALYHNSTSKESLYSDFMYHPFPWNWNYMRHPVCSLSLNLIDWNHLWHRLLHQIHCLLQHLWNMIVWLEEVSFDYEYGDITLHQHWMLQHFFLVVTFLLLSVVLFFTVAFVEQTRSFCSFIFLGFYTRI